MYGVYKVFSTYEVELVEEYRDYDDALDAADSLYLESDGDFRYEVRESSLEYPDDDGNFDDFDKLYY